MIVWISVDYIYIICTFLIIELLQVLGKYMNGQPRFSPFKVTPLPRNRSFSRRSSCNNGINAIVRIKYIMLLVK